MDDRIQLSESRGGVGSRTVGFGVLSIVVLLACLDEDGPLQEARQFVKRWTQSAVSAGAGAESASVWQQSPGRQDTTQPPAASAPAQPEITQTAFQTPDGPPSPVPSNEDGTPGSEADASSTGDEQNVEFPPQLPDLEPRVPLLPDPQAPENPSYEEPAVQVRIPINDLNGEVQISGGGDRISLQVNAAPVNEVLTLIAQQHGLNVVAAADVSGNISVNLVNARLEDALDAILRVNGYTWSRQKEIILVTSTGKGSPSPPGTQG